MMLRGWPASELRGRPLSYSATAMMLVPGMVSAEQAKTRSAEQAAGSLIMRTDIRCLDPAGVASSLERPGTDVEEKNWMLMMCEGEQPAVADSGEVAVDCLSILAVSFLATTPPLQRRSMLLRTPCGSRYLVSSVCPRFSSQTLAPVLPFSPSLCESQQQSASICSAV